MAAYYGSQKLKKLQALLRERGLNAKGCKNDLVERLMEDDNRVNSNVMSNADHVADDDDVHFSTNIGNVDAADYEVGSQEVHESEAIRILKLQIELEKIKLQQSQVQLNTGVTDSAVKCDKLDLGGIRSRLPIMTPDCDVIAFFMILEKTLELNAVPRELWARFLPSVLNERAGKIFAQQPIDCCRDYDKSRALLINAFKCGADVYLRKLQTSRRTGNESYIMFMNRLAEYQSFYLQARDIADYDALKDDVLMNHFMASLRDDVLEFVRSRQPKNAGEAAAAADLFYSVKSKSGLQGHTVHQSTGKSQFVRSQNVSTAALQEAKSANNIVTGSLALGAKKATKEDKLKPNACWSCGSLSHKRAECPTSAQPISKYNGKRNGKAEYSAFLESNLWRRSNERFVIPCFVKGRKTSIAAYRDSGASVSIAHENLVDRSTYTGETISVKGLFGPEIKIPTAVVQIKSPRFSYDDYIELKVGVVDCELPFDVDLLIGNDLCENHCDLIDVIRVEEGFYDVGRDAEVEPAMNEVCSKSVVSESLMNVRSCASHACETVVDRAVQCDLPGQSALSVQTDECVTSVTHGRCSRGGDDDFVPDAAVNLTSEKLGTNSTICSNKDVTNSRIDGSDNRVSKATVSCSPAGNLNQIIRCTCDEGGRSAERAVVAAVPINDGAPVYDDVTSSASTESQPVSHDTDGVSTPVATKMSVVRTRDSDAQLRAEFARLSAVDNSIMTGVNFDQPNAKQVELANLQRADPALAQAWQKATEGNGGYVIQSGILYKQKPSHVRSDRNLLLVLPHCYKKKVLEIAHDSVCNGGHTAFQRTAEKILKVFFMPKKEIKQYCSSCVECQRLRPKCINERADYKIPLIECDFGDTFVIDVMGGQLNQLSRRHGNYKFVLVCVEKATRWVELIPLPSLKAATLTAAIESNLIARFACQTLVYDQQSGFMSELMQSVLKLLRVRSSIAVAGFHAKTSIAERYVRTVESYIKPYLADYKGNWSMLLPWIAFQLRQTPCSTLNYSAHELAFGKNFADKLNDFRDDLEGDGNRADCKPKKDVLTYMLDLKDRLSAARQAANEHAHAEGVRTKQWYDRNATANKVFKPGDKCLILESVDPRKLFARWSEPATVISQKDHRSYDLKLNDGTVKTFHVNQLRLYNERTEFVNAVVVAADTTSNFEDQFLPIIDDEVSEPLKFNIEESLPPDKKNKTQQLLMEFGDVFRLSLGKTHLAMHKIQLNDDTPCVSKSYRIPEALKQPLEDELNRLLDAGVLRHCSSDFRSPLIPIRKPNGTLRLVNAFQAINARTKDDLYPMSNPLDILSKAAGRKWISKIDLSKAFLQVPLHESCQKYTAFQTTLGTLCWTRTCLGLKNSPRTMQRLMDSILRKTSDFAGCMVDDIVISSETFDLHLSHLREILSRLREANLTASISKSEFLMKSMTVLGYCLEDGLIKPSSKHIEAVLKIGPQTTKHGVRAVLGILNYHRAMIPSFAEITLCLTDLLKKNQPERNIRWEQKHTDALIKIKTILTSKPVLVPPRHDRGYIIMSDATQNTIAGILAQKDDHGIERNVAYFSRKLLPNEVNYSVIEKEALGILASCLKWHDWVYGHSIIARTDHRALAFLDSTAQHNARIARWKIILSNYDIVTEYRKGADHGNCDALSRIEFSE